MLLSVQYTVHFGEEFQPMGAYFPTMDPRFAAKARDMEMATTRDDRAPGPKTVSRTFSAWVFTISKDSSAI